MTQAPKKKRLLPKNIQKLSDHDLMEKIFGQRAMKAIDKVVAERSQDIEKSDRFEFMKGE